MEFNSSFRVAKNEYIKWITNPKMIIIAVMMIFAYDYIILELTNAADKMGVKLQIFEGFIGISNSPLLLMIIPIVFVGLMGDFPRVDSNVMFYIFRVGKFNWLFGQIIFSVMASATYLLMILGFSTVLLLGRCYTDNVWSDVTTKYYLFAPDDYDGKVANITTGRLYNNITPVSATISIIILMFLLLLLISVVLLVGFIFKIRLVGIVSATGFICLGNIMIYTENQVRWLFPTTHAMLEIHFDTIYKKPIFDIRLSYLYYIFIIIILVAVAFLCIDMYDFSKVQELEE